jgi:glycosyltransferase involved in cell wall biosynthesis
MAEDPLYLVCIEPRFPGRLGWVADWLVRKRGFRCQFYCNSAEPRERWPASVGKGLELVPFNVGGVAREQAVPWTRNLERGLCYAYGCYEVLDARRPRAVDLVLGRSVGLGSTLFVPASLPGTPIVNLFDYYLHPRANDLAGEMAAETSPDYFHWRRAANALDLLDLENGVRPWIPTRWQLSLYLAEYQADFLVLHDGIATDPTAKKDRRERTVAGRSIALETRVVTFVARYLERLRGFDRFMHLANRLTRQRGDVLCIVAGASLVQRGLDVEFFNRDYKAHLLEREPLHDPARVWFLESAAPSVVAEVLAASDLHVYPSRPYPVSRSLLEAMGRGCAVLAWDSEPVREFIVHDQNGLIVSAEDAESQEKLALAVLSDPDAYEHQGNAAAALIREQYAQDVVLRKLAGFLNETAARGR